MRVVGLQAENFKRIRAVDIRPDGDVVVLAGANAQGKTSILDAIWAALGGSKASPDRPIRTGETDARVTVDLGEIVVTRTWRGDKTELVVTAANGAKITSPQRVLDTLVGKLAFDPLKFANAAAKDQLAMLLEVVKVPLNLEVVASDRAQAYEERTIVGRETKRLEGALASLPDVPPTTPNDEVDIVSAMAALGQAERFRESLDTLLARKRQLETELAELMQQASRIAAELPVPFGQLPAWIETERAKMLDVDATNKAVAARKAKIQLSSEIRASTQRSEELTHLIGKLDQRKAIAISNTPMPVEGLGFNDEGVTYRGVPFTQASGAERIKVSVAVAMAANPNLRVIHISDGSLLDNASQAVLATMAAEHDMQVWVEVVDESGQVGIVIEDGMVVS